MGTVVLKPPFERRRLESIASMARKEYHSDARGTVEWLLRHPRHEEMTSAIRTAWGASSLPLATWAGRIVGVEACTPDQAHDLNLLVYLEGEASETILQKAPFETENLERCLRELPGTVPDIVRDIAVAAPGLTIGDFGPVGAPEFYTWRLARISEWAHRFGITHEDAARFNCIYPDPSVFLMEIAGTGLGPLYALHRDGNLFFYDWPDLPGLIPCSVSLEDFIACFFHAPQTIADPYGMGWTTYPVEQEEDEDPISNV